MIFLTSKSTSAICSSKRKYTNHRQRGDVSGRQDDYAAEEGGVAWGAYSVVQHCAWAGAVPNWTMEVDCGDAEANGRSGCVWGGVRPKTWRGMLTCGIVLVWVDGRGTGRADEASGGGEACHHGEDREKLADASRGGSGGEEGRRDAMARLLGRR